jgi:hypothetical protein
MMFEGASIRRKQRRCHIAMEMAHEIPFAIIADAIPQDEIMHATADVDRIDLNVAVVGESVPDVGDWFVEQQRSTHKAASGLP